MGILSNAILYNKTINMGDFKCSSITAYGNINVNGSLVNTSGVTTANSFYLNQGTSTMYIVKNSAYSSTMSSVMCASNIYITSTGKVVASSFSGPATNSTKLNNISYAKFSTSSARRNWWKCTHTLSDGTASKMISYPSGTIGTIFYGMGSNYVTAATTTNVKVGDYVFDEIGHIGVIAGAPNDTSAMITTVWQSATTWTCLEEGTMITMADWSQKPIEEVHDGDIIMGYDFEKNEPTPSVVLLNTVTNSDNHTNYLIFDNGELISCTDCHELYSVDKGRSCWIDEISEGERFLKNDGTIIKLRAMHKRIYTYNTKQFYQLISSNNTYIANNILNSLRPHMKHIWLVEYMKRKIPDDILEIFKSDAEEFTSLSFLVRDSEFREKSINSLENAKLIYKRLCELKDYLKETDYISFKQMEGIEVDQEIINKRQEARNEINMLEKIVSEDYNSDLDKMMKEKSPIGDDVLTPIEEKLSKYFHKACKRDNENFELFKKYFKREDFE